MFQRIVPNIVPPEMAALLLSPAPKIKGYMFRRHQNGLYYGADGVLTILKSKARIYALREVMVVTRNHWNWGRKDKGTWVVAYEDSL